MHAGHQELVVAGVLHDALAALGGFRLVHVVVGIDFGMVLLQGVTVHQIADDKHVRGWGGMVVYGKLHLCAGTP